MKERRPPEVDTLIFGQGPVLPDKPNKIIVMDVIPSFRGALNWWGSENVQAGIDLTRKERSRSYKIMGGYTGPSGTFSEAELTDMGISSAFPQEERPDLYCEKGSTNTLENLVNICNEQIDAEHQDDDGAKDVPRDIMGAGFHLTRMKLLMNLFDIPYRHAIGADSMMRYAAIDIEHGDVDQVVLTDMAQRYDLNAAVREPLSKAEEELDAKAKERGLDLGYYAQRDDPELKTISEKQADEDVWTRALLTIPEYSMKYFGQIKDDDRLRRILWKFDELFSNTESELGALERHGIVPEDIAFGDINAIREKLLGVPRVMPNDCLFERLRIAKERGIPFDQVNVMQAWKEEHATQGWPDDVEARFQQLLSAAA